MRLPAFTSARIMCAPVNVLPVPGGLDRQHAVVELEAEPLTSSTSGSIRRARQFARQSSPPPAERDPASRPSGECGIVSDDDQSGAGLAVQSRLAVHEARRTLEQKVARRAMLARSVDPVRRDPAPDLE